MSWKHPPRDYRTAHKVDGIMICMRFRFDDAFGIHLGQTLRSYLLIVLDCATWPGPGSGQTDIRLYQASMSASFFKKSKEVTGAGVLAGTVREEGERFGTLCNFAHPRSYMLAITTSCGGR